MNGPQENCTVFKATRKRDHYLYVADGTDLEELPGGLLELLGELHRVMDLDLAEREALANADIVMVRAQLAECGYYLQMPPQELPDPQGELFPGEDRLQ